MIVEENAISLQRDEPIPLNHKKQLIIADILVLSNLTIF